MSMFLNVQIICVTRIEHCIASINVNKPYGMFKQQIVPTDDLSLCIVPRAKMLPIRVASQ